MSSGQKASGELSVSAHETTHTYMKTFVYIAACAIIISIGHLAGYIWGIEGKYVALGVLLALWVILSCGEILYKRRLTAKIEAERSVLQESDPEYLHTIDSYVKDGMGWNYFARAIAGGILAFLMLFTPPALYTIYIEGAITSESNFTGTHLILMFLGLGLYWLLHVIIDK